MHIHEPSESRTKLLMNCSMAAPPEESMRRIGTVVRLQKQIDSIPTTALPQRHCNQRPDAIRTQTLSLRNYLIWWLPE